MTDDRGVVNPALQAPEVVEITWDNLKGPDLKGPLAMATVALEHVSQRGLADVASLLEKMGVDGAGQFKQMATRAGVPAAEGVLAA